MLPGMPMDELVPTRKERKKISKNEVIEIAEKQLLEKEIKNGLRHSFTLAADDKELIEMAECGTEDYLEQLKEMDE